MAIIVSKNGKNAVKVDKSNFALEDHLQQYIYDNPESIPLYDIKEDIKLLILAREFSTKSGPIDAVGIDREGEIYLVETKLYKNPDKRTVVAQVLDYGASLWSNYRDFSDFIEQISAHTTKDFNQTLNQRLSDFYNISEDETNNLLENTRRNLSDGNFKFVVLMDHLHPQLKDLIIFLNNNSEFTVYAVELEFYKHQDFEILIPKLYGSEVKKDLGKSTGPKIIPTDEEFINAYQGKSEQEKVKELFNFFNDLRESRKKIENVSVDKTPKYLNLHVTLGQSDRLNISLSINPEYESGGIQFWGLQKYEREIKDLVKQHLPSAEVLPNLKTQSGKYAKWQMKDYSTEKFENLLKQLSKI